MAVKRSMTPVSFNLPSGGEFNGLAKRLGEGGFGLVVRCQIADQQVVDAVGTDDVVLKVSTDRQENIADEVITADIRNAALFKTTIPAVTIDGRNYDAAAVGRAYNGTLFDHQRPCSERFVARLGVTLCQSVIDAERHGIVHRDIKPENILLERDHANQRTNGVLGDWGFKAAIGDRIDGITGGTGRLAAPEQFTDITDPKMIWSAKTDVYSIAATQFEVMTGSWWRQDYYTDHDQIPAAMQPYVLVAAADGGAATREVRIAKQWTDAGMADVIPKRDLWHRHLQSATTRSVDERASPAEYLLAGQGFLHQADRDLLSEQDLRLCVDTALAKGYAEPDAKRAYLLPVRLQAVTALAQDDRLSLEDRRRLDAVADRILDHRQEPAFADAQHRVQRSEALAAQERRLAAAERVLQTQHATGMHVDAMGASRRETDLTSWEEAQDREAQAKKVSQRIGGP